MYFLSQTDGHFINSSRHAYLTPKGEDDYYRRHSFAPARSLVQLCTRLMALRLHKVLSPTRHTTIPASK